MKTVEEYVEQYVREGQTDQASEGICRAMGREAFNQMCEAICVTDALAATILDTVNDTWEEFARETGRNRESFMSLQKNISPAHFECWMEIREGAGKSICV